MTTRLPLATAVWPVAIAFALGLVALLGLGKVALYFAELPMTEHAVWAHVYVGRWLLPLTVALPAGVGIGLPLGLVGAMLLRTRSLHFLWLSVFVLVVPFFVGHEHDPSVYFPSLVVGIAVMAGAVLARTVFTKAPSKSRAGEA